MGRAPNLSISQWFRQDASGDSVWRLRARCIAYQHLPWTSDTRPHPPQMDRMRDVCNNCPVIARCASYALEASGGFYAGIWLPWHAGSPDTKLMRRSARSQFRRIAKLTHA